MERPWQITNEEQWDGLRAEVTRAASGILAGSVDLITGARQLASLSHKVHADKDPDFVTFIGIHSGTDVFPLGTVRQHWNPDALAKYDLERERAEQQYRPRALECARRLLTRYAQNI
jgi:hypothetical protein